MKKNLLLLTALHTALLLQSQSYTWKGALNFSCCTGVTGFAFDNAANMYISGTFYGDTYVGSFYLVSTTPFHYNSYIAKMNSKGSVLWAKLIGSNDHNEAKRICADKAGNIFITGQFNTDLVYEGHHVTASQSLHAFILKINGDGDFQWWVPTNGSTLEQYLDVTADNAGNAYVTGRFSGTVNIGSYSITTAASGDMVVAKFNAADGIPLWVQQSLSTAPSYCYPYSLTIDKHGNIYTLGNYGGGTTSFQSYALTSADPYDYCMAKLNNKGNFIYAYDIGSDPNGFICGVKADTSDNIYIAGGFGAFSPYTASIGGVTITSSHNSDLFIAKFNSSFALKWLKQGGSSTWGDFAEDITVSKNGNVYVAFVGGSTVNFDGVTASSSHPGYNEINIVKFKSTGVAQWANVSGSTGYDGVSKITYQEKAHAVAIAGNCPAGTFFGSYEVTAAGGYVAGLIDNDVAPVMQNSIKANSLSTVRIFPVPAHGQLTISGLPERGEIFLYDEKGILRMRNKISGSIMNLNNSAKAKMKALLNSIY